MKCTKCNGTKYIEVSVPVLDRNKKSLGYSSITTIQCPYCKGTGQKPKKQ